MITKNVTNVSTLRIHKLTQEQYDRENEAGTLEENAIYITPDEGINFSEYYTKAEIDEIVSDIGGTFDKISALIGE